MTASLAGGGNDVNATKRKRIRAILESLRNGSSMYKAVQGAGISVMTFWRWRQASRRLELLVLRAVESQITMVEDALYGNALGGNVVAQMFFLMNRAGDKWKDKRALVNNINAIKIGDGKRVDREFIGEEREQEQRLTDYFKDAVDAPG